MYPSKLSQSVEIINPTGLANIILICEHASNFIPPEYNNLGLDETALKSHIAWDPGALEVAKHMANYLTAPLVVQNISRLVYDCNRPPEAVSAIPYRSEIFEIPGNANLSDVQKNQRIKNYYEPFNHTVSKLVDEQIALGVFPIIVTIHSFTPIYYGKERDVEIGILHDKDTHFADVMLNQMANDGVYDIQKNQPYGPQDGVTHTIKQHGQSKNLLNVMIEIRNDIIVSNNDQTNIAKYLSDIINDSIVKINEGATNNG